MIDIMTGPVRAVSLLLFFPSFFQAQELRFASLGDLRLESGETIRDCRIGYRTLGSLSENGSNAVLFPTWFTGTTANLVALVGPGKLVDPSKHYVILVDAIGNGVSTSPSNSKAQPRMKFPKFTIRDMVESQHRLVTETLHINHLKAVVGISMGGMQTFQWAVSYPDFFDKAIPIVGSPQLSSIDLLLWTAEKHAIEEDRDWNAGNYKTPPPMRTLADIHNLALSTPEDRVGHTARQQFGEFLAGVEKNGPDRFDTNNWYRQLEAMLAHDVAAPYGGSLQQAAQRAKAQFLIAAATQDHMVNPTTALAFAEMIHAQVLRMTGSCGHLAPGCEQEQLYPAVTEFLAK